MHNLWYHYNLDKPEKEKKIVSETILFGWKKRKEKRYFSNALYTRRKSSLLTVMFRVAAAVGRVHVNRRFMSDLAKNNVTQYTNSSAGSGGSSLMQRLTAFVIGTGIVSPLLYHFIYEELKGMLLLF